MTVVSIHKDVQAMTMTFVAEFGASVERLWQVWQDPRQLERWWGPPGWPATFAQHDLVVGSQSRYYMTGPEGERSHGWWTITAIDAPRRLEFDDGFADQDGEPLSTTEPVHIVVTIEAIGSGARMTTVSTFNDAEQLEQMVSMGMEEGMRQSMDQIDAVLADADGVA